MQASRKQLEVSENLMNEQKNSPISLQETTLLFLKDVSMVHRKVFFEKFATEEYKIQVKKFLKSGVSAGYKISFRFQLGISIFCHYTLNKIGKKMNYFASTQKSIEL